MKGLLFYEGSSEKPFGFIGILEGKLVAEGLEYEYYNDWLGKGVFDLENKFIGIEQEGFLQAVKQRLLKNVLEDEVRIEGPDELKGVPELVNLTEGGVE